MDKEFTPFSHLTPKDIVDYSRKSIANFPFIKKLMNARDFNKWKKSIRNPYDIFVHPWNLLNSTVLHGYQLAEGVSNQTLHSQYETLLSKLNLFLETFSDHINPRSKAKLKIIGKENYDFLSTLSEISLAYWFKNMGYDIQFESNFENKATGTKKDVDISISRGSVNVHFEVYMPHKQIESISYEDFEQNKRSFNSSVKTKISEKFGESGLQDIDGKVFLAVNQVFHEQIFHNKMITAFFEMNGKEISDFSNRLLYDNLTQYIPTDISGILFFSDAFDNSSSFEIDGFVEKVDNKC